MRVLIALPMSFLTFGISLIAVSLTYIGNPEGSVPISPNLTNQGHTELELSLNVGNKSKLITAGEQVGDLHLGDSKDRATELFGRVDTEYDYNIPTKLNCSERKELRFWELHDKSSPFHFDYGNGAWVFLRENKVDQIKIQSSKFKTKDGITVGAKPDTVRRYYRDIKTFVEINTQCDCDGGRNLIFWVDETQGIAFEFHYWKKYRARRVSYILIFKPKTPFLPEGCVYLETQGWEEIKPFSLEEPKYMQKVWEDRNR